MTIYFDMDGVLAIYERQAYIKDNDNNMLFQKPKTHYFRTVKPDIEMMSLFKRLLTIPYVDTHIISSLSGTPEVLAEHYNDKLAWIKQHEPTFMTSKFHPVLGDKGDAVEQLHNKRLTQFDILIDDYNPNLISWAMKGGTAIKYLNGLNSEESWDGLSVDHKTAQEDIISLAKALNNMNAY